MDRILDRAQNGPSYLKQPDIAELMIGALYDGDARFRRYSLHAFVVMPNHVHLLVTPQVAATRWLGPLKGFTAYAANKVLGIVGRPFWQDESYDHLVRNNKEFERILNYIEWNPVKAGLVECVGQFQWSSAFRAEPPERRRQAGLPAPL
jgi:REP element-mobilizing transposase RayT